MAAAPIGQTTSPLLLCGGCLVKHSHGVTLYQIGSRIDDEGLLAVNARDYLGFGSEIAAQRDRYPVNMVIRVQFRDTRALGIDHERVRRNPRQRSLRLAGKRYLGIHAGLKQAVMVVQVYLRQ